MRKLMQLLGFYDDEDYDEPEEQEQYGETVEYLNLHADISGVAFHGALSGREMKFPKKKKNSNYSNLGANSDTRI